MLGHQKRTAAMTSTGTGLGLTLCTQLVKIYQGVFKLSSRQPKDRQRQDDNISDGEQVNHGPSKAQEEHRVDRE